MKKITKIIIFAIIFFLIFFIVDHILWIAPTPVSEFYKEKENSLDIVYIGSSNTFTSFNNLLAYDLYGYKTGFLAANSQAFGLAKYLIIESEKYQNPSLYVIDIAKVVDTMDKFSGENIRETVDSMKFSKNRIEAINEILSYKKEINKKEYINYYFSFFMYHNRWKNMTKRTIVGDDSMYKGFRFDEMTSSCKPQDSYEWKNDLEKLDGENEKILLDLIKLIKDRKLNVLFVVPVRCFNEEKAQEKMNYAIKIIEDNGFKVINFNKLDDFKSIDFKTDLYNGAHINVYGSTKYTLYFAKYLKENYNLPNHKIDEQDSSWNDEYERFKNDFKKLTGKDFDTILKEDIETNSGL